MDKDVTVKDLFYLVLLFLLACLAAGNPDNGVFQVSRFVLQPTVRLFTAKRTEIVEVGNILWLVLRSCYTSSPSLDLLFTVVFSLTATGQ